MQGNITSPPLPAGDETSRLEFAESQGLLEMAWIDLTATELLRAAFQRWRQFGRTDPGVSRPDRQVRRRGQGVPAGRSLGGARPGGGDRSAPRGGQAAGATGRPARGRQGLALHQGEPTTAPRGCWRTSARLTTPRSSPVQSGRRRAHRPDEHGRVRHGRIDGELGLSVDPQSLGPDADSRRIQRRGGRGGGRAHGPLSLGTDTGGSIRCPAGAVRHQRNEADLRPGEPLRAGRFRQQPRSDRPLAASAEDLALLLEVLAGHDPLDSTSIDLPVPALHRDARLPLESLRIGLVREHFGEGLDAEVEAAVREAVRVYESLGAKVKRLSMPHGKYGVAAYYIIAPCEASSNLARYDGVHYGYRTDEKRMIAELESQRKALEKAGDAPGWRTWTTPWCGCTAAAAPRPLGPKSSAASCWHVRPQCRLLRRLLQEGPEGAAIDPAGLRSGLRGGRSDRRPGHAHARLQARRADRRPAVDVPVRPVHGEHEPGRHRRDVDPCGFSSAGLPIGLHLQSPPFEEERLLRGAHMFQQATDWHTRREGE